MIITLSINYVVERLASTSFFTIPHFFYNLLMHKSDTNSVSIRWIWISSTSIYDLLLLNVCHFHHHHHLFQGWLVKLLHFSGYRDTRAFILDLASMNLQKRTLSCFAFCGFFSICTSQNIWWLNKKWWIPSLVGRNVLCVNINFSVFQMLIGISLTSWRVLVCTKY